WVASRRLGEPGLLARSSRADPDVREPVRRPADRCPGRAAAADRARPVNCPKKTTRAEREPVRRSSAAPLVTRLTRVSHLFGVCAELLPVTKRTPRADGNVRRVWFTDSASGARGGAAPVRPFFPKLPFFQVQRVFSGFRRGGVAVRRNTRWEVIHPSCGLFVDNSPTSPVSVARWIRSGVNIRSAPPERTPKRRRGNHEEAASRQ